MRRRETSRRRLLAAVGAATTAFAGCTGSEASDPTTTTVSETPTDAAAPTGTPESTGTTTSSAPRDVTFQSAASTPVEGTLYGSGDCGVVLVPHINLDRGSWAPQATALQRYSGSAHGQALFATATTPGATVRLARRSVRIVTDDETSRFPE
jgi:hypothetical protein